MIELVKQLMKINSVLEVIH